jgi:hypothetical protein
MLPDRTTQTHLEQCQEHLGLWFTVGVGCVRLDLVISETAGSCSIQVAGSSTFLVFLFPADGSAKVATI